MNRKLIHLICLFIGIICLSCEHRETYYHFYELKNAQWSKTDTLYFNIDSSQIVLNTPVDVQVELNNNSDYPYRNIWLFIQDDFANDKFVKYEKQYELADDMGKWFGSGFGSLYQLSLNYKERVLFTQKRNYQIKIVQGMRDEPLTGIEKVGVKISVSE